MTSFREWFVDDILPILMAVIAVGVLAGIAVLTWPLIESKQPPPRPRIEVLSTDGVRCVVVYGVAVECQWELDK